MFNQLKKQQQIGDFGRGSPLTEHMMGGLMQGLMPDMPTSPQQTGMGGMGMLSELNPMGNYSRPTRFANKSNLKKFLMQYSYLGKNKSMGIDLKSILKI